MAAEAAAGPLALVTSCAAGFAPQELVKRITGKDDLTVGAVTSGRVTFYPWTIDNKYYSADIHLCVVPNTFHVTGEIAESVQAFVVYFDSTIKTGLESVSEWLPLTEEWLPEVLILVCDRVSENGVNRQKAQEWCIKHGFELVELNPEELPDEDDDFPESTGVKRIVQALNANVWSNVVMKSGATMQNSTVHHMFSCSRGGNSYTSLLCSGKLPPDPANWLPREPNFLPLNYLQVLPAWKPCSHLPWGDFSESISPTPPQQTEKIPSLTAGKMELEQTTSSWTVLQSIRISDPVLDMDIQELASLTTRDGDLENFERLLSKLKEMKDKAATLPHEQRKLHAEKVAKAFWMAIGGDRDEIEGLSSDEEN